MRKRVVVRATIEYDVEVPSDWGAEQVEFWLNESASCANNAIRDIGKFTERLDAEGRCACDYVHHVYVRDAEDPTTHSADPPRSSSPPPDSAQ